MMASTGVVETKYCIKADLVNVKHVWTIEKLCYREESLFSSVFFVGDNKQFKWRLELEEMETNLDGYSINIKLEYSNRRNVRAKFGIFLIDGAGQKRSIPGFGIIMDFNEGTVVKKGVKKSCVINKADNVLPDGNLTICCEGSMLTDTVDTTAPKLVHKFDEITGDLQNLFETQTLSDIKVCVQGTEIPAHKAILAARSPVFCAMFVHDTMEHKESCVEIKDLRPEVVNGMLRYIYTGHMSQLKTMAEELLVAADKYAIAGLKLQCEDVLGSNLTVQNACSTLILADTHSCENLKTRAVKFITARAEEVLKTDSWEDLVQNYPALVTEVFLQLAASQSGS